MFPSTLSTNTERRPRDKTTQQQQAIQSNEESVCGHALSRAKRARCKPLLSSPAYRLKKLTCEFATHARPVPSRICSQSDEEPPELFRARPPVACSLVPFGTVVIFTQATPGS